jgi:energy-coupling factor transporter ATP-binding protein EcfA2
MTDEIIVTSLGTCVRLHCRETEMRARVALLFDGCRTDTASGAHVALDVEIRGGDGADYEVRANGDLCWSGADLDRALEWCAWLVNNAATERASELVVHAAAAAIDGRIVLLTGPSGSGKSTLVTALALRDAVYLSDDTVVVDGRHRIRANPKPIALDQDARAALLELDDHNGELRTGGALAAPRGIGRVMQADRAARASVILRTSYRPGTPTSLERMSPGAAAEVLADQSFNFATLGPAALQSVAAVARRAPAFELEFGDLADAVDAVFDAVGHADALHDEDPPGWSYDDLHIECCSGEALIWNQGAAELHHLSPTATEIWRACQRSEDPEAVAALLRHPSSTPIVLAEVRNCIDELRASGLLSVRPRRRPPMAV